ncbi:helix-turn-helix transcriptional regulator [Streptomyces sp. MNU89]|uniref:helix-turn-helix domain-containing protein n=1 Tax=Streptomyces sp. MNU89 TaxID=2560025 RepID=UPI001E3E65B7|nr:helix-turn-helix transcriptional regulator [Streptomyces sp. MNU89]MCC9737983.1 helix-turn-helix domain-containing protein [Streptomyces sp. MNU89]
MAELESRPEAGEHPETEHHQDPLEDSDGTTDLFRALGKQIKLLRERAGLTQRELGERLRYGEDLISSVERGRRVPQPELLEAADQALDAGGLLAGVTDDVVKAKTRARVRHPAWFRDYARIEAEAVELNFFSTLTVPGLLQTEDYARLTFSLRQPLLPEEVIEQRVAARLARQELLTRWPSPIVTAVLDESVLLRRIGGREVQLAQLRHLHHLGQLRSTSIQVLPLSCEDYAGHDGPFVLLTPKGKNPVAYLEVQGVSRLVTDQDQVRIMAARYGGIRGQALTPRESLALIEKMLRER